MPPSNSSDVTWWPHGMCTRTLTLCAINRKERVKGISYLTSEIFPELEEEEEDEVHERSSDRLKHDAFLLEFWGCLL